MSWFTVPSLPNHPTPTGWRCPGCGRCYAPGMPACTACGPKGETARQEVRDSLPRIPPSMLGADWHPGDWVTVPGVGQGRIAERGSGGARIRFDEGDAGSWYPVSILASIKGSRYYLRLAPLPANPTPAQLAASPAHWQHWGKFWYRELTEAEARQEFLGRDVPGAMWIRNEAHACPLCDEAEQREKEPPANELVRRLMRDEVRKQGEVTGQVGSDGHTSASRPGGRCTIACPVCDGQPTTRQADQPAEPDWRKVAGWLLRSQHSTVTLTPSLINGGPIAECHWDAERKAWVLNA